MHRYLPIIICLFSFNFSANSQTSVSGVISTNTTWTKANSPYVVTNNILVSANVNLTIEPGVEIRFENGKYLKVEGEIKAIGTVSDSIIFTSVNAQKGSWENVWLKGTASAYANNFDYTAGSIFQYCRFSHAKEGLRIDDATIQVKNTVFYNNVNGINFKKTTQTLLHRNTFKFNTSGTSTSAGTEDNGIGSFTFCNVIENTFENNTQVGFSFGGYRNNSNNHQIRNNIVRHNGGIGFEFQWGDVVQGFSNSTIQGNIIYKNGSHGILICRDQNTIRNNIIFENKGDGIGISGTYIYTGLLIENNIIANNGGRAVDLSSNNNTVFQKNQIINSGKPGSLPSLQIANSYITSINNSIVNNTFSFSKANDINIHYGPNSITGNNFFGVKDSLFIRVTSKGNFTINATGNYWASLNNTQVVARIFDKSNDFEYGTVNYTQPAQTPNVNAPISPVQNLKKRLVNGRVLLEWSSNIEADLKGYRIYYGGYTGYSFSNVIDAGNVTTYTLPSTVALNEDISVTAYDLSEDGNNDQLDGNESWYSLANVVPVVPTNFTIDSSARRVRLAWSPVNTATNYNIYRSIDNTSFSKVGSSIQPSYIDSNLTAAQRYYYKITAFDSVDLSYNGYGLESDFTSVKTATPSNIFYVDPVNGTNHNIGSLLNPILTIQQAINRARNGDSIILARGVYYEAIDLQGKIRFLSSNYYLSGDTADIHNTILSGKNNGNVNLITNTINCNNATSDININGITITEVRLQAINLQTINCTTSFRLTRSVVKNSGTYAQWGVVSIGMNGLIDSCTFHDNRGRYILSTNVNGNGVAPVIRNSIFYNNASSADGSVFTDVSTIHVEGKYHVINNLIYRNRTTGIDFGGNGTDSAVFVNNTVVLNSGHGIRFETWGGSYNGFLINNISSFNKQSDISANTQTAGPGYFLRNNFFGKNGLMLETNLVSPNNTFIDTSGNIGGDPFFVDTLNNNYRLQPFSPAIGAGATTNYLLARDVVGSPRINSWRQVPDIGAYESIYKFPAPIITKTEPGNKRVRLFWTQKNSGSIKGYIIYRSKDPIPDNFNGAAIATVNAGNIFTYIDSSSDLENKTKYFYRIRSIYNDNAESGLGKQGFGVPNMVDAPQQLRVINSPKIARISWNAVSGSNIKYQLFRDTDSTQYTLLADSINRISFIDSNFARNRVYFYRVRTIDSAGALSDYTPAVASKPTKNWYVDSTLGNDNQQIGSVESPLATISKAVAYSITGDTINVGTGTYTENIIYKSKVLSFIGTNGAERTLIKPLVETSIFYFDEVGTAYISGFTLMNGSPRVGGSAILSRLTDLTVDNVIFRQNASGGGVISTQSGTITMNNCLAYKNNTNTFFELSNSVSSPVLVNNFTYYANSGLLFNSGNPNYRAKFRNSIIWNSTPITYSGLIEVDNSIFKGGFPTGRNIIDAYPEFIDTAKADFRLSTISPALGLGDTTYGIRKDFNGMNRPNPSGYHSDAGIFESVFDHAAPVINQDSSRSGLISMRWTQYPAYSVNKVYIYKGTDSLTLTKYDSAAVNVVYRDTSNNQFNSILYYSVSSIGSGLRESGLGNIIRTISFTPPVLRDNILGPQDSSVTLSWSKINNALRYNLQIGLDSSFANTPVISISDTTHLRNGLLTNTSYYWRVQTLDSTHTSRWSAFKVFKTRLKEPIITRIAAGNKVDTLFWSANKNINVKKYYIYRDTVSNPTTKLDSVSGSTLMYIDTIGLKLNVKYFYRIAAVDSSDNAGPLSAIVNATPFNRKPIPVKLANKEYPNAGNFNTVRTLYSALGSYDTDGRIVKYKWYVNDSLMNDKDSVFIHYYKQGLNKLKLVVMDNDSTEAASTADISISSFVKTFSGGFLGGIAALDNNNLYIADSTYDPIRGASVYKVDKNGNTVFPLIVTSKIFTTPSVSSDSSLFITNGSSINGFNFSGAPLWPTISLGGLTYVTPTIDSLQSRLYIGVSNANFFAIDYKTGKVSWNINCDAAINSSAVITGDRKLVFVSNNGTLYGFDLTSNISSTNPTPKWRQTFANRPSTSPAVDTSNNIYFGTSNGKLLKLRLLPNGSISELWNTGLDGAVQASPIIDGDGFVYVGTENGGFYKINPTNGVIVWSYKTEAAIRSTPTISDFNSIYVADMSGTITSLSTDGNILWTYKASSPISANILYINNSIYVGTQSGKFIGIYDNPSTNTVNTSLSSINVKYGNSNTGLASFRSEHKLLRSGEAMYDQLVGPPLPLAVKESEPIWGTFQGNAKRTGSRRIECPNVPNFFMPTCTNFADSITLSTSNLQNKYWVVNQNVLRNYTDTSIQVKYTDNVKLMAYNEVGCNVFAEKPILLSNTNLDKPRIRTSTGSFSFCNTDSIILSSTIAGDRYQWLYMSAPIAGGTNNTFTTSIAGGYSLTITNKAGCTATSDVVLINALITPSRPLVADRTFCLGETASALTATISNGHTARWYGTNAVGGTASSIAPTPTTSSAGVTKYFVSQQNQSGCESERAIITVTINAKPALPVVSPVSVCQGGTAPVLSANALVGHQLKWYGTNASGGTATGNPPTLLSTTVGVTNFYVSQISLAGCESDRALIVYTVNANPVKPVISWNGTALSTSSGFSAYQWLNNNSFIANANSNVHQPTSPGNYQVTVTSAAGCSETSSVFNLLVTAISNPTLDGHKLNVYPNPTAERIFIDLGNVPLKTVYIQLYQKDGKLIKEIKTNQRKNIMDLGNLSTGHYILKISSGINSSTMSVIKY